MSTHRDQEWLSPEMARAEHELLSMVDQVDRDVADADAFLEQLRLDEQEQEERDAKAWEERASRPDATPAWRWVAERVESGDISWSALAQGATVDDPDLRTELQAEHRRYQESLERRSQP